MTERNLKAPMESPRPSASYYRGDSLVVSHAGADAIRTINRQIGNTNKPVQDKNPNAVPASRVTDMVHVHDLHTRSFHFILVHRLDHRPQPAPAVGNVVVFSKPAYAAYRTEKLQLATPRYYRDREDLEPGIRDRHDGMLTKDGTRWANSIMGGSVDARLSFVSLGEPWVYCASHYRTDRQLHRLRSEFRVKYGYTAATQISDPSAFAEWLGIDFALALDKTNDISLGPIDEFAYKRSSYTTNLWDGLRPIDTIVHVYHGPVNYEDVSGRVDSQQQWFDPNAGPMAWFTKKTAYRNQFEYRFAVTTLGTSVKQRHYVAVSRELSALTSAIRVSESSEDAR